jgi:anti-sigma regulatory factor (Ser/Thr protein kinase)
VPRSLAVTLVNELAEIRRLGQLVEAFAAENGLSEEAVFYVGLALDEVVMNVIRHGYDDAGRHEIAVQLELHEGVLRAEVRDDGRPFDPLSVPPVDLDRGIDERGIGGLGVHVVRSTMDSVDYRREDGRNVLVLRKRIVPGGPGDSSS